MNPNFRMDDPLNHIHMRFFLGAQGSTVTKKGRTQQKPNSPKCAVGPRRTLDRSTPHGPNSRSWALSQTLRPQTIASLFADPSAIRQTQRDSVDTTHTHPSRSPLTQTHHKNSCILFLNMYILRKLMQLSSAQNKVRSSWDFSSPSYIAYPFCSTNLATYQMQRKIQDIAEAPSYKSPSIFSKSSPLLITPSTHLSIFSSSPLSVTSIFSPCSPTNPSSSSRLLISLSKGP